MSNGTRPCITTVDTPPSFSSSAKLSVRLSAIPMYSNKTSLFRCSPYQATWGGVETTVFQVYPKYDAYNEWADKAMRSICDTTPYPVVVERNVVVLETECCVCKTIERKTAYLGRSLLWVAYAAIGQLPLKPKQRKHRLVMCYTCGDRCLALFNLTPNLYTPQEG